MSHPTSSSLPKIPEEALVFISDLHLDQLPQEKIRLLGTVLESLAGKAKELFIMGDIGDGLHEKKGRETLAHKARPFFQAIQNIQNEVQVHYLPGNHDSWYRDHPLDWDDFPASSYGSHTPVHLNYLGQHLRLSHGDELDPTEQSGTLKPFYGLLEQAPWIHDVIHGLYKVEHGFWKGVEPLNGLLAEWFPESHEAIRFKTETAKTNPGFFVSILWQFETETAKILENEKVDAVIMGHTHTPRLQRKPGGIYLNTGDWLQHSVVSWMGPEGYYQQDVLTEDTPKFLPFL